MNAITNLDADLPLVSEPDAPLTGLALFRDRRERAAALWRAVPARQFDLSTWYRDSECGTVACALGWLAVRRHDGWFYLDDAYPTRSVEDDGSAYVTAARYFGLRFGDSVDLFGGSRRASLYGMDVELVTPGMVAEALLAAPYDAPEVVA